MFDADRPILKSTQDRLNRTTFAKYLARCLLDHKDPESLVVGLYGGWGVGKTSIINLIVEELQFAATNLEDKDKPIVLNFSPWSYSGQHQLIYSFFRRLSSALRNAEYLENSERIIRLLELYVSFFTNKPIPKPLRAKKSWFAKFNKTIDEENYAWESGRDLTLVKAELNELLRKQNHKIIIIIDNISRLYNDEIKQIFQIVKSMGDYANTAYLLSFDKHHVVKAINQIDGSGGEELVAKVVQLPFDIPPILQQDLENILADRLNEIIKTTPEDTWSKEYWADIFYSSLKSFFHNVRDITRYVNTLNFSYPRLRDVVNPVDFFALTAIEVFLPNIYTGIRDNKDLFTDLLDNVYVLNKSQIQKDKVRCDEILSRSDHIEPNLLLELLMRLFPRIRKLYQPEIIFYHSENIARKLKRICSPDLFDAYFRLSIQSGQIPATEFETILSLASDSVAFDQALTRLNQDDRILKFLDQLDSDIIKKIPQDNINAIINALIDNGDLFPQGKFGPINITTPMRIHRIIHALLRRYEKSESRFAALKHAIANANKSIHISVYELQEQGREHNEESDTFMPLEYRDLTPQELDTLKKLAADRIASWAKGDRLILLPHLLSLLHAWRDWGDNNACQQYLSDVIQNDRSLTAFLVATLHPAIEQAMTKYEKTAAWEKYLIDIAEFVDLKKIEERAKLIFEDQYFEKLKEQEQLAIMIFLDLVKSPSIKIIPKTTV